MKLRKMLDFNVDDHFREVTKMIGSILWCEFNQASQQIRP